MLTRNLDLDDYDVTEVMVSKLQAFDLFMFGGRMYEIMALPTYTSEFNDAVIHFRTPGVGNLEWNTVTIGRIQSLEIYKKKQ